MQPAEPQIRGLLGIPAGRMTHFTNMSHTQSWSQPMNSFLGNWQVSGIHVVQSGLPLTAILGGNTVLNLGSDRIARPNLIGNPELRRSQRTVERWFNTDAFAA